MKRFLTCLLLVVPVLAGGYFLLEGGCSLLRDLTYDFSEHTDAEEAVAAFARENGYRYSDYPEEVIALLERNPEAEEYVLNYPAEHDTGVDLSQYEDLDTVPLFLQWDQRWGYMTYGDGPAGLTACGPVCLSMAAYYLTGDESFSPDRMIEYAGENGYYSWGNGTKWTLISEGAVELGFDVTEIPLVKQRIMDNLEAGNPIICAMGPGDFTTTGHFIVLVGTEDGLIRVNDPNSRANSELLWDYDDICDQIRNLWVIRYFG